MLHKLKVALLIQILLFVPATVTFGRDTQRDLRLQRFEEARVQLKALILQTRSQAVTDALSPEAQLGALLYNDKNLSVNRNQSCATCHQLTPAVDPATKVPLPSAGFTDADNTQRRTVVSNGSVKGRFGSLNAPSTGYAAFSPFFHWDPTEGLYVGGQFWNGRANTLEEQAGLPFLNPVEMAMPNQSAVISRVQENPNYWRLFNSVYKIDLAYAPAYNARAPKNNSSPAVTAIYAAMTKAIAAFEKTRTFSRFSSKFDFYLAGQTTLSPAEQRGLDLFNGQANCAACHVSAPAIAPDGSVQPPMFTDFTYDNIGLPRNVNIPANPSPNLGLGGRPDAAARNPSGGELGKHKVMSLRNIAVTPPYGHNGVFRTLEEITHFYNTRDVIGHVADINSIGVGTRGWPEPEVPHTVNHEELGNLGLSDSQEADLVSFMHTLTDGYPDWGKDPNVPHGTPSPYAGMPLPPFP